VPLEKGTRRATISKNIHEMVESGHPVKQAVAAALHTAHPRGGHDSYNEEESEKAEKKGALESHDEDYARPTTAMTAAEINEANKKYWAGENGNLGPAESQATAPELAGTRVAPIPVYRGMMDEVSPTQSDPPDARSDNLLERGHGGVDESFEQWAKEESEESEHKGKDEHIGFKKLEGELAHKKGVSNPRAVAAAIGIKKYGKAEMERKAHGGDELVEGSEAMEVKQHQ